MVREGLHRCGGDGVDAFVQVSRVVPHAVAYQEGNIRWPLAQRRDREGKHVQPVVEFGAEVPGVHQLREIPVSCRHQAHIDGPGRAPPTQEASLPCLVVLPCLRQLSRR
jgi:hypothetical protein